MVVVREGDPRGAIALALVTEGVADERGAEVPVALAALVEARVGAAVSVVPSRDGVRARGLAANDAEATALTQALGTALLTPVAPADMAAIRKKIAVLSRRPLADAALEEVSRCEASLYAPPGTHGEGSVAEPEPSDAAKSPSAEPAPAEGAGLEPATVEAWRKAVVGLGRVSLATIGGESLGDAVASALGKGPEWPAASTIPAAPPSLPEARAYDATGDVPAGGARVTLTARAPRADDAVRAAGELGDPNGALAARLGGLDAPAKLRDVTATAHAHGGCVSVSFDFPPRDLAVDAPARIATAIALARQEIASELVRARGAPSIAASLARRAGSPRDAADLAAWWALSGPDADAAGEPKIAAAVGFGTGRESATALRGGAATESTSVVSRGDAVRAELDRAVVLWHEPVVEAKTRTEKGQGDLWIAFGSPCGTLAEMESDAGLGAAFALAAADRATASLRPSGGSAEAWASPDGIGVVAHGPALPGESPEDQARRLGDAVARSFAAEPVDRTSVSRARARLLGEDGREDARALVTLADAVVPGHPSWIAPMGPVDALGRSSDASAMARASALRAGPLRVAVLANANAAQADAAVRAVDRWVARHPGQARACPVPSTPAPPRSATYAVDAPPGGSSQAWLALALPPNDANAAASAEWIAAALDGTDGLLAHALGGGLARSWSARVVGAARASALVVRVDSAAGALDAAVAQVRSLFDRVRQGSLSPSDFAHASALLADRELASSLDPSRRVLALWKGATPPQPPTADALRAFASSTLRDEALIIVAVRPPRSPAAHPSAKPS